MAVLFGVLLNHLLGLSTIVFAIVYFYFKWSFQFWKRKGVPQLKPFFPFGNRNLHLPISIGEDVYNVCLQAREKGWRYFGMYIMARPYFVALDCEIVKHMLSKDFDHFRDRGLYFNEKDDPLSAHFFLVEGTKWKNLRTKFTPNFTPMKMKMMFPTLLECGLGLENYVKEQYESQPLEAKSVMYRYGINVIGSCAFGVDCNTFKKKNTAFEYYAHRALSFDKMRSLRYTFTNAFPNLSRRLGLPNLPSDVAKFFLHFVSRTVEHREKNHVSRKDFLQMLIDMKNSGNNGEIKDENLQLTFNELAAQCYIFFAAGYETSSAAATFALYELAFNQDIQDGVREEINRVLAKYNNEITYEGMNEMVYLKQVMDETLRKYPSGALMMRVCTKDYVIPGAEIAITKDTCAIIPVKALHWDPKVFPDPEVFDPERFSEENKRNRHPFSYIPFGEGPRICIGLMFGVLQFKLAMVTILKNFRIRLNSKTDSPLKIDPKTLIHSPAGGVWLDLEKL